MTATIAEDTPATGDLLQRLQTMDSYGHKPYPTHFVNPDGPEAARVIAGLVAALEPFAKVADDIEREYGERPAHQFQFPPLRMCDFTRARAALTLKETEDVG